MKIPRDRGCLFALCALLAACGGDEKTDPTVVKLADGSVQGAVTDSGMGRQFLGIPYAKPPVGELRFQMPQKPDPWKDVRDATKYGKRCAQLTSATLQNEGSVEEDCLYLNVWTPLPAPSDPLPVMIWIHGGGNVNGSTSEPVPFVNRGYFYTGEFLAEGHGVVVVSMNYRLGLFGFFGHPDLWAEGSSGNQGLLDQQLAFQWVKDNIAKFGGDPGKVTIFGESAGSFDVCMHMASPGSAGLFHRAISESGGCTTKMRTKAEAEAAAIRFATDVGCTGAGTLACLRGKSAAELMATPDVAMSIGFGTDVDTLFLPDQPRTLYDAGMIAKVPYLLGSNTDEGTLFLPETKPATQDDYNAALTVAFGAAIAPAVANVYPMASFADGMPNPATAALARAIGDARLVCTTLDTAVRAARANVAVYMYNFDIPVPINPPGSYLGATHGSEIPSVFGTSPAFTTETKAASDLMQRYWTNFARTGDPNAGADPKWPAFAEGSNVRVNFALQPTIVSDFRATECAFWRAGYAMQFP
jgi:para-nitrobenzyl esterase